MIDFFSKIRWSIKTIFKDILYIINLLGFSKYIGRPFSFFFATPLKYQWDKVLSQDNVREFVADASDKKILMAPIYGFSKHSWATRQQ